MEVEGEQRDDDVVLTDEPLHCVTLTCHVDNNRLDVGRLAQALSVSLGFSGNCQMHVLLLGVEIGKRSRDHAGSKEQNSFVSGSHDTRTGRRGTEKRTVMKRLREEKGVAKLTRPDPCATGQCTQSSVSAFPDP